MIGFVVLLPNRTIILSSVRKKITTIIKITAI